MRTLEINLKSNNYNIYMEKNIFNRLKNYLQQKLQLSKVAIITDHNLQRIYGKDLNRLIDNGMFQGKIIAITPGEESKSMETLQQVYKSLAEFKLGRGDLIITFGGGVVGDLGGFAAATYLRGIPYIQVPTSLLSQVDSSIGGKVAVDLPYGKNLVGSFYHPEAVFIDTELLKTLDKRYLQDGLAEVIKYGCIKDKNIITKLMEYKNNEELIEDIENIVYTCCNIKKTVVEMDEKDFGERMLLNFGHTLGHALEKHFNYKTYTHGEAVAIGMIKITEKSEELLITEKGSSKTIEQVLKKYQLPCQVPKVNKQNILDIIALDKKMEASTINLILLKKIGEAFIEKVSMENIENFI